MTEMSADMEALFMKRAYDIAGTTPGIKGADMKFKQNFRLSVLSKLTIVSFILFTFVFKVFLNGKKIAFNAKTPFKDYCKLYIDGKMMDSGQPYQLVYENLANPEAKGRWEVGFAISDHGVQNISFVNSINTIKVN